jgi:hypothetical protein
MTETAEGRSERVDLRATPTAKRSGAFMASLAAPRKNNPESRFRLFFFLIVTIFQWLTTNRTARLKVDPQICYPSQHD